jgi:cytochrome oxidase assembly protein ShyY1
MASPQPGLNLAGRVFFGSLCGTTFGLGCWQAQRLLEKRRLVDERTQQLQQAPILITSPLQIANTSHNKNSSFQRLLLRGNFHHQNEFLVGPRGPPPGALPDGPGGSAQGLSSAPQGYYVITPLEILLNNENNTDITAVDANEKESARTKKSSWFGFWKTTTTDYTGAKTISSSAASKEATRADENSKTNNFVLVNRGWVPRRMVIDDSRRRPRPASSQQPQQQVPSDPDTTSLLYQWERPTETVQVMAVSSPTERTCFSAMDWIDCRLCFG